MLAEVDPLPCPQHQRPCANGYRQTDVRDHRPDVRGHVVRPLARVGVRGIILGSDAVEPRFQIIASTPIGVLLYRQTCGCVLDEDGAETISSCQRRDRLGDLSRDLVKSLAASLDGELDGHVSCSYPETGE